MQVINGWLQSPEDSDAAFWTYIVYDINKIAFHTHDGTDGDLLPPSSLTHLSSTVTPSTPSGNLYYADKAFPTDNTWSNTNISFFLNDERIYLDYEKIDEDNYRVWSALNGTTYEVRYA
jgi:hypothetical protein